MSDKQKDNLLRKITFENELMRNNNTAISIKLVTGLLTIILAAFLGYISSFIYAPITMGLLGFIIGHSFSIIRQTKKLRKPLLSERSDTELNIILEEYIRMEDYESASKIRDILHKNK
jgi:hypothetical protein